MYTLGGGINEEQGWGRARGELHRARRAGGLWRRPWLVRAGRPGHRHARAAHSAAGRGPHAIRGRPAILCDRWQPGVTLLPMSDDPVRTHVTIELDGAEQDVHFQEWWVRLHAAVPALRITATGADRAAPAPGVLEAISAADFVLLPPSNPVVSVGVILAVPGIADAVRQADSCRRFPDHRRRSGARHGGRLPDCDRSADLGHRGRRALRTRPAGRLAGRRQQTRTRLMRRNWRASRSGPGRCT